MALRFLRPTYLFNQYSRLLEEIPIPTKVISCTVIMSAADTIQQYIEYRALKRKPGNDQLLFWKQHHDIPRLMRMITFMALFHVPYLHFFHLFLDARILRLGIKHPTAAVIAKVSIDQLVAAPPYMAWFLLASSTLEGKSWNDTKQTIKTNWWPMLYNCWFIWVPGHCVTYSLPFKYRSVWCDFVRVFWGLRMSYFANKEN